MKATVIPIVGPLGAVTKEMVNELEEIERRERVETIQTTALLRSVSIPRRVLETLRDLLSLKL